MNMETRLGTEGVKSARRDVGANRYTRLFSLSSLCVLSRVIQYIGCFLLSFCLRRALSMGN
ncbi:hypothetical protein E2C01_048459 [Portunus trituberculatus]|uniref:Uncharacterized protein n=1 Tax=Portunus trituberculatus TaxID=210409 RepID=A0A5B7GBN6_PORTR|nr:hypothetical protein [Portunus trituberculatus]